MSARATTEALDAALAFAHATVASLPEPWDRATLFAHAALVAGMLGRVAFVDALFRGSVAALSDFATSAMQPRFAEAVAFVASALVVAPAPNGAPLFWARAVGAAASAGSRGLPDSLRVAAKQAVESLVDTLSRAKLPYTAAGMEANDALFAEASGTPAFAAEARAVREFVRSSFSMISV